MEQKSLVKKPLALNQQPNICFPHLHNTEVDISLRKRQQWADKLGTNVHLHNTFLASTGAYDSMAEHALLHSLWPLINRKSSWF